MRHIISDLRGNPIYTSFGSWRGRNGNRGSISRNNGTRYNPRSILFSYVKASNWNSVIRRAESHPEEILMFDDNGNSPLHIACQLDPPVEVLISLKALVTETNSWGATPLHIAASNRCNIQALRKLIDFFPGALYQLSKMHRAPIHYACMSFRGLDLIAFQALLEETIKECRRLKEEHNQQHRQHCAQEQLHDDSKITTFVDILREAKDDINNYDTLDDEEISIGMTDGDSQHAGAFFSTDSLSSLPSINSRMIPSNQKEEEEKFGFGLHKNNYNVVTWKDDAGRTPLGLLFCRYRERVKRVIKILEQKKNSKTRSPRSSFSLQTDLGHLWGKARLIVVLLAEEYKQQQHHEMTYTSGGLSSGGKKIVAVERRDDDSSASGHQWSQAASWSKERFSSKNVGKASHESNNDATISKEERQFLIVHASVGLTGYGCPPEMIRLAISIYPNQVKEMDEFGNLPLHIAAAASSLRTLTSNSSLTDEESSVLSDSIASLFSSASTNKNSDDLHTNDSFDKVIKLLLKQYPQAAQTPNGLSGRLPLVLADRAGNRTWNDGMRTLLRAYPPALFNGSKGVIPVKLYPYVLCLIGGGDPPDSPSRNSIRYSNFQSTNTLSSLNKKSSNNRFNGRCGIGLLHNLMLMKQRQVKELTAGTSSVHGKPPTGRRNSKLRSSFPNQNVLQTEDDSHTDRYRQSNIPKSLCLLSVPSEKKNAPNKQHGRKKRAELATTMFELLRAKPDLIDASRSHQERDKSNKITLNSHNNKSSPAWAIGHLQSTKMINRPCEFRNHENQRLSFGTKKKASLKLIERMKVFERKSWKTS